jgi:hypothetical protein
MAEQASVRPACARYQYVHASSSASPRMVPPSARSSSEGRRPIAVDLPSSDDGTAEYVIVRPLENAFQLVCLPRFREHSVDALREQSAIVE